MVDTRDHQLPHQTQDSHRVGSLIIELEGDLARAEVRREDIQSYSWGSLQEAQGDLHQALVCVLQKNGEQE